MSEPAINVLMVCLGNICRSPTAEAVFRSKLLQQQLEQHVNVDSAGTGDWHVGEPPDSRAIKYAVTRNYDLSALRARQITAADFDRFDYIVAMDRANMTSLKYLSRDPRHHEKFSLLMSYTDRDYDEVPDPYYSGAEGFSLVLDLVEEACGNLLDTIAAKHGLRR